MPHVRSEHAESDGQVGPRLVDERIPPSIGPIKRKTRVFIPAVRFESRDVLGEVVKVKLDEIFEDGTLFNRRAFDPYMASLFFRQSEPPAALASPLF
jgi:hypothetical protein